MNYGTMATTIQVDKKTAEILKKLKNEEEVESYNQLILRLVARYKTLKVSKFGKYPKLRPFKREEIDRLG